MAVVAGVWCNNKHVVWRGKLDAKRLHQTHYWALRQQARCSLATACGGRRVVALLWWWGVVFDLWIVVASIEDVAHVCVSGLHVMQIC